MVRSKIHAVDLILMSQRRPVANRSLLVKRDATPLRTKVVERLRAAICMQRLPQGSRLVERELCQMMGVSRTSIREALRQLEAEGLVSSIAHRGPSVAVLDRDTAAGIYEVRAVLEALAGRLFVERAGPEDRQRLKAALAAMLRANEQGDITRGLRGTGQFYDALFAGARNEIIAAILRPLSGRIYLLRARSMSMPGRREESLREMEAILEAALASDPQAAWDACLQHVQNASAYALQSFDQEAPHPEGGIVKARRGRAA
jgi:GntR family transcriptional regulator, trigonelline degradation regulator